MDKKVKGIFIRNDGVGILMFTLPVDISAINNIIKIETISKVSRTRYSGDFISFDGKELDPSLRDEVLFEQVFNIYTLPYLSIDKLIGKRIMLYSYGLLSATLHYSIR